MAVELRHVVANTFELTKDLLVLVHLVAFRGEFRFHHSGAGRNETLGATAVIDWLNGRKIAYTSEFGDTQATPVNWHNGHTAMMGTSYNGTIPAGGSTSFGFQGTYSGSFAAPGSFTLNGSACTTA